MNTTSTRRSRVINAARKSAIANTLKVVKPTCLGSLPPAPKAILRAAHKRALISTKEFLLFNS